MKPYYEEPGITIYHGDCREILPLVPKVDLILTDPPYGIGHVTSFGASWQRTQIAGDFDTALRDYVWDLFADTSRVCFGTWKQPAPKGVRGALIWDKGSAHGSGDLTFPWKPSWEEIYVAGDGWSGFRDEGVLRFRPECSWESGPSHNGNGRVHPHQKPVELMVHFLHKHPGHVVLDPFMGSGTTLVACKRWGRKAIGIEIEEKYCEIAARRLQETSMPLLELLETLGAKQESLGIDANEGESA